MAGGRLNAAVSEGETGVEEEQKERKSAGRGLSFHHNLTVLQSISTNTTAI